MRRACGFLFLLLFVVVAACSGEPLPLAGSSSPAALPVVPIRWANVLAVAEDTVPRPAGAPISLTSPEGVGLEIAALQAAAVIEEPLAFTELHFTFRNPQDRTIEGRFEMTLPPGATISRFAMKQDAGWQEGEVVEKEAARVAYEDFLHRRSDPALLEKQAGNRLQARVFPIPAASVKEIIVSYAQELVSVRDPYRVFLRGLPRLGRLDLRVLFDDRVAGSPGRRSFELHEVDFTPDRDFALALGDAGVDRGLRHEGLVVARVKPIADARPDPIRGLLVLVDTSASRALDLEAQAAHLGALLEHLGKRAGADLPLAVACFDQELAPVYVGPASGFGRRELDAILERRALGATDLAYALSSAAAFIAKEGGVHRRVLLLTDGVATAGPTEGSDFKLALEGLREAGVERVDVLVAGGIREEALVRSLTTSGFARDGVVLDGDLSPRVIAERLGQATVSGIQVRAGGARWVWPTVIDGVSPGDEVLVYADVPAGHPFDLELRGPHGTSQHKVVTRAVERPLIERAVVKAQLDRLARERDDTRDEKAKEQLKQDILALSTKHRVLTDFTALLVLETDADYARFHIDRRALTDILVVGPSALELMNRNAPALRVAGGDLATEAPAAPAAEEASLPKAKKEAKSKDSAKAAAREEERPMPAEAAPAAPPAGNAMPAAAAAPPPPPPPPPPPSGAPPARDDPRAFRRAERAQADRDGHADRAPVRRPAPSNEPEETGAPPYDGKFAEVMGLVAGGKLKDALDVSWRWREAEPGDVLALVGLGEAYEARGDKAMAARAYGSIIDLYPSRADLRRFAGDRLERLGVREGSALGLAVDTYKKAVAERPDHPASHRSLAYALARAGRFDEAFDAILAGYLRAYPSGRFAGVHRGLYDDVGILAAAWRKAEPGKRETIAQRLEEARVELATKASLRFVLTWETDQNDVDFHIRDGRGGHAYYRQRVLKSGGELYADVTTGYGPEFFVISGAARAFPYKLRAHYFRRGPMGYGMGKLEVVEHDGRGGLSFDERPYVVMRDRAFVDLGVVAGPIKARP